MVILLINVTFNKGSTGNIVSSLYKGYIEEGHKTFIIYRKGDETEVKNCYNPTIELESKIHHLLSLFTGNLYGGMHISTLRIIRKIKKINPDVIHLHCLNGYFVNIYKLVTWLKKKPYKVILTNHADFMMTANCGIAMDCDKYNTCECRKCNYIKTFNSKYSLNRTHHFYKKMLKAFINFPSEKIIITGVSPWLSQRIKESALYNAFNVKTVLNPVDEFFVKNINVKRNNKQVLYVTPDFYDELKGGKYLLDIASKLKEFKFVIIDAKEQNIKVPNNVKIIFHPSKEILREIYQSSYCTLILSKRETFSMVALESLASGTPIIGFKNGGTNSWASKNAYFYEYGDINSIIKKIRDKIVFDDFNNELGYRKITKSYLSLLK